MREAIKAANNTGGADTITFSVSGTINVSGSDLPNLTANGTTIDGGGSIRVDGVNNTLAGLKIINCSNNVIRGLTLVRFSSNGIEIFGASSSNNLVAGCMIGTNGSSSLGNSENGIRIREYASNNTIGGTSASDRNIISGNVRSGVQLDSSVSGNFVVGNYIGTNASGTTAIPNTENGVIVSSTGSANTIGGSAPGAGNVISGNSQYGVSISAANGTVVKGNYIGTNAAGNGQLSNSWDGVRITSNSQNTSVGGPGAGEGNVISKNLMSGVRVDGGGNTGTIIRGNFIGLGADGTTALGNSQYGVAMYSTALNSRVGGTAAGQGNHIAQNGSNGVYINATTTVSIAGNSIHDNGGSSIILTNGGNASLSAPTITGIEPSTGTLTGGGVSSGDIVCVYADDGADSEAFVGAVTATGSTWSLTGLDLAPYAGLRYTANRTRSAGDSSALSSIFVGEIIVNTLVDENNGTTSSFGALLQNPGGAGISLREAMAAANDQTGDKLITFSVSGTIGTTTQMPPMLSGGVTIDGGGVITIDGQDALNNDMFAVQSANNVLRGLTLIRCLRDAIEISGSAAQNNQILGCFIGTNSNGDSGLGNDIHGIRIQSQASNNTIGGADPAERNIISGNTTDGVSISGSGTTGNVVIGNYIGTKASGTASMANGAGVQIDAAASGNTIGGDGAGEGNIISGNDLDGVLVSGAGTNNNIVIGNIIGLDATGTVAIPNGTDTGGGNHRNGVNIESSASGNRIGGSALGERNIIAGNSQRGVQVDTANNNQIIGNYIGVDITGVVAISQGGAGVFLWNTSSLNTVTNNVIGGASAGILLDNSSNSIIKGNYSGVGADGSTAVPNANDGIQVRFGSSNNAIGGTGAGEGNVFSGNGANGVYISDETSDNNNVIGNIIGLSADQSTGVPNQGNGVYIYGGSDNTTIGTSAPGGRNVISANLGHGIILSTPSGATSDSVIRNNKIGTNDTGAAFGNGLNGIDNGQNTQTASIGGSGPNEANEIAYNTGYGVRVGQSNVLSVGIRRNSIHSNSSRGIALDPVGGNNGKLAPVITSVNRAAGQVSGSSGSSDIIDLFADDEDEGRTYLASTSASGGTWSISGLALSPGYDGSNFTATATDGSGNTSEFSLSWANEIEVTNTNDVVNGTTTNFSTLIASDGGDGISLREAMTAANNMPSDTKSITFAVSGTIGVSGTALPSLTSGNIQIDGAGQNIRLDGNGLPGGTNGLRIVSPENAIRNITLTRFPNDGIVVQGTSGRDSTITGCYIGTDGASSLGMGGAGIVVFSGSDNNQIGGTTVLERNVISGNAVGISIQGGVGNKVTGNLIGTDSFGATSIPNLQSGIELNNAASNTTIGGTSSGAGNVISGNGFRGITISGSGTDNNVVRGNIIGLDAAGSVALGNGTNASGISIGPGPKNNIIGGTVAGARNIISGNQGPGIGIGGAGTSLNRVEGNYIGTNSAGTSALGNGAPSGYAGIVIDGGATNNTIGGTTPGARNVISGNAGAGLDIQSNANTVSGNYIGVNAQGAAAIPNGVDGVSIVGGATGTTIGGTVAGAGNVISGNDGFGIQVDATSTGTVIQGNRIGVQSASTLAVPNGAGGVRIDGDGNTVGGTAAGAGNIIARNSNSGVLVNGGDFNPIRRNTIFSNASTGIALSGGGNTDQPAPTVTALQPITGTAEANSAVDLFADLGAQGRYFLQSVVAQPDGAFSTSLDLSNLYGLNLTATATDTSGNTSAFSVPFPIDDVPPPAPQNLEAEAGARIVGVTWDPVPVSNIVYDVYRQQNAKAFQKVTATPISSPEYVDTNIVKGETYTYYAVAIDALEAQSAPSNTSSVVGGALTLTLPSVSGNAGDAVLVPVGVANADGVAIDGLSITLTYPTDLVEGTPVVKRAGVLRNANLTVNTGTPGVVQANVYALGLGQQTTLTGEGRLVEFQLQLKDAVIGCRDMSVQSVVLADALDDQPLALATSLPLTASLCAGGSCDLDDNPVRGDATGNGTVDVQDIFKALRFAVRIDTMTPCQFEAADVNIDGNVDSGDAILIDRLGVGLPIFLDDSKALQPKLAEDYRLAIGTAYADPGDTVDVAVHLDSLEGVAGVESVISFPLEPGRIELVDVITGDAATQFIDARTGSNPDSSSPETFEGNNVVRYILTSQEAATDPSAADIVVLRFQLADTLVEGDIFPITFNLAHINDDLGGDIAWTQPVALVNGGIIIGEAPPLPDGEAEGNDEGVPVSGMPSLAGLALFLALAGVSLLAARRKA